MYGYNSKSPKDVLVIVICHRYPKLAVVSDVDDHFIFVYEARRGPKPDVDEFKPIMKQALTSIRTTTILADAGYASESNHRFAREQHHIRSVIPAKHGRPTKNPPRDGTDVQNRFDSTEKTCPALPGRNRDVHDKTPTGQPRPWSYLPHPVPRPPINGP